MNIHIAESFTNQKLFVLPREILNDISLHPLLKNLYITDVGFYPRAQYHFVERKEGCKQNILIYCTSGEGYIVIENKQIQITKNTILIIPKDLPHIYGSSMENPWDIYWSHFKGELDKFYISSNNTITLISVPISSIPILTTLFENIFESLSSGPVVNNIIYASQCFSYFLTAALYMPYNKHNHRDKKIMYIEQSLGHMEKNIDKMLTLQDLTKVNNLSKTQLTEIFKEITGYSPIDFFIRLKVQKACNNLDLSDLTISEVALNIGYQDQYYFSRIFKKIMGISPSEYRKIKKG